MSVCLATVSRMRMCEPFRTKGWWFGPESPDDRVPGILTWSQAEGVNLEVIGGIRVSAERGAEAEIRSRGDLFGGDSGAITIFGETDAGKPVSLWNVERHGYTGDAFGSAREEFWHGPWACIGAHIPSVDAVELQDPLVALDNLYYRLFTMDPVDRTGLTP